MTPKQLGRSRRFTVEDANAALPLVRAITSDLAKLSVEVLERRRRVATLLERWLPDCADPYMEELIQVQEELEKDSRRMEDYVNELRELGVEPTDPAEGVVAFPALIDGRDVYLCWQLGEPEVLHWREVDAAFEKRRPLLNPA